MKNLFDYATKELSQDAFLRWFLESDIDDSGKKLLAVFTGVEDYRSIKIDKTWAQSENIDITVDFKNNNTPCILIIEDKVGTNPHDNQLIKYMKVVEKWNSNHKEDRPSHFVYFKPRLLSDFEQSQIKEANESFKEWEWKAFDIDSIHGFFRQYAESKNVILKQYAEHIEKIHESCHCDKLPSNNDVIKWQSYFGYIIKNNIPSKDYKIYSKEYQGRYAMLIASLEGEKNSETPYLEIRSRDCLNNKIVGRILIYGKEITKEAKQLYKEEIIKKAELFEAESFDKQIASTKKQIVYKDELDFADKIKQIVDEYIGITDSYRQQNNSNGA